MGAEQTLIPAQAGTELLIYDEKGGTVYRVPLLASLIELSEDGDLTVANFVTVNDITWYSLEPGPKALLCSDGRVHGLDGSRVQSWPDIDSWTQYCEAIAWADNLRWAAIELRVMALERLEQDRQLLLEEIDRVGG